MKKIKLFISILTVIAVIFSLCNFCVSAADTTIICESSVEIGNKVTVTINMQPSSDMLAASCVVNYNQDILNYVSGATSGGAGSLKISLDDENGIKQSKFSATLTFETLAVGSSTITVKDCVYTYQPGEGQLSQESEFTGASATVNVTDKILSGNADLKKLSLSKGTLSPKFSAATTEYTASVPYETTRLSIYATASDSGAKVSGSGVKTLQVGDNSFDINVTAPNGTVKTYKITVKRLEEAATSSEANTSSENTTSIDYTNENPYEVLIDDNSYIIATDISGVTLLKDFSVTTADYKGVEVAAAVDSKGEITVFYLTAPSSTELLPYIYNSAENSFEKLKYISQGEYDYIVVTLPKNYSFPEGYFTTNLTIGDNTYECYGSKAAGMSDFSYLYCYANGKYGVYRYDSSENVLQRCPEVELVKTNSINQDSKSLIERFTTLSKNSKIIVMGILLVCIFAVALIVLVIVHFVKKNDNPAQIDYDDYLDFDDVSVEEGVTYDSEYESYDDDYDSLNKEEAAEADSETEEQ